MNQSEFPSLQSQTSCPRYPHASSADAIKPQHRSQNRQRGNTQRDLTVATAARNDGPSSCARAEYPHWPTAGGRSTERAGIARWAPYLDLRGRAGAAGAEEAIGRGGGGLGGFGGGGADGVGAAVARLVGAAVTHRRRGSPSPSAARRRDLKYRRGRERVGTGVAASSQRTAEQVGVVETTRRLGPTAGSARREPERERVREEMGRAGPGSGNGRNLRLCPWTAE